MIAYAPVGVVYLLLALLALVSAAYGRAPIGECDRCPHCVEEKRLAAERLREAQHDADHQMIGRCRDEACPRNPPSGPPAR